MNCCFRSKHHEQVWIPAGETFRYECDFTVAGPGPFEAAILLYLEDHDIRPVTLTVRGVGTPASVSSRTADYAPQSP